MTYALRPLAAYFVLALLLAITPVFARAQTPEETQAAAELKAAEAKVTAAQSAYEAANQKAEAAVKAYEAARDKARDQAAKVARLRESLQAAKEQYRRAAPHIRSELDRWKKELEHRKNSGQSADKIAEAQRYVTAHENWLRRRLKKSSERSIVKIRAARLKIAMQDLDTLTAKKKEISDKGVVLLKERDAAMAALATARSDLDRLRKEIDKKLASSEPPFLQAVQVRSPGGKLLYDAKWVPAEEKLEQELRLTEYLVKDINGVLAKRKKRIDTWIELTLSAQKRAQKKLDHYLAYVGGDGVGFLGGGTGTWLTIGVELLDAGVTVFRDWKTFGPYAVAIEAAFQVKDALTRNGKKYPQWDVAALPGIANAGSQPTPAEAAMDGASSNANSTAQKNALKNSLKAIVRQEGKALASVNYMKSLAARHKRGVVAIALSDSVINGSEPVLKALRTGAARVTSPSQVIQQFWKNPSRLARNFKSEFLDPGNWKDVARDLVQTALKDALISAIDSERIARWTAYMVVDAERSYLVSQLKAESALRRYDQQLLQRVLDRQEKLRKEILVAKKARTLEVKVNKTLKGKGQFKLKLGFNRPVNLLSVQVGGKEAKETAGKTGKDIEVHFDLVDLPDPAKLAVQAVHPVVSTRVLDNPASRAIWNPFSHSFSGYEGGTDTNHKFRTKPIKDGKAYAIILDTSGSMDDNNRIGQAKSALQSLLASKTIKKKDTVALYTFVGCGIANPVPFTSDKKQVSEAINNASTGASTPLAAGILTGARALFEDGRRKEGVLVVVTDGEESCDGNPAAALIAARKMADAIKVRKVR